MRSHVSMRVKPARRIARSYELTATDFLPIILRENLKFSLAASQCLIAPPYALAAILMVVTGWAGDRYRVRGIIIVVNSLISLIGLPIMAFHPNPSVRYFGVFIAVAGTTANTPATMAYQVKTNQLLDKLDLTRRRRQIIFAANGSERFALRR